MTLVHVVPSAGDELPSEGGGVSLRDRVRSSHIQMEFSVELLLLCIERFYLRWFRHLIRIRNKEQIQDLLKGFCVSSGLGTTLNPPGEARECGWKEGSLGFPPEPITSAHQTLDKWNKMDE